MRLLAPGIKKRSMECARRNLFCGCEYRALPASDKEFGAVGSCRDSRPRLACPERSQRVDRSSTPFLPPDRPLLRRYRPALPFLTLPAPYNVRNRRILQNLRGRVPHLEKHLIERPMLRILRDQTPQLLRVSQRRQRTIHQPDNIAQRNLRRIAPQLVAAARSPHTVYNARVLQLQKNQFQELLRQVALRRNLPDLDRALIVSPGQRHHGLQRVQPFLRDLQFRLPSPPRP